MTAPLPPRETSDRWTWSDLSGYSFWARLQAWLQGWPTGDAGRISTWLDNRVSDLRYYAWRLTSPLS